jgi:hypothetical protein
MEARRFDTLTKALGSDTTRRRMLRGLVAGAGGGALTSLVRRSAVAAKPCSDSPGGGCFGGDRCCPNNGCYNPDVFGCFHCGREKGNRTGDKGLTHAQACA